MLLRFVLRNCITYAVIGHLPSNVLTCLCVPALQFGGLADGWADVTQDRLFPYATGSLREERLLASVSTEMYHAIR